MLAPQCVRLSLSGESELRPRFFAGGRCFKITASRRPGNIPITGTGHIRTLGVLCVLRIFAVDGACNAADVGSQPFGRNIL